jgi:CelD/BcsL family acetyltransferase involved in cellulose biosynthesis
MPATIGARPNPLIGWERVRPSRLFGNIVHIDGDFEAWRFSREKTHRKELERSWRVFTRHPNAEFRIVSDMATAERVMAALEEHQRRSIADKGWNYILDLPAYRAFYRDLLAHGLATGEVVLSSLLAGDETVAALLGVRRGDTYAMIRIGNAMGEWRNCSPGRLVIERTMHALHAQGVRHFDFTIGDYYYKKGFQPDTVELHDLQLPLSWKGFPRVWVADARRAAKDYVKARPELEARVRRLLGKAPPAAATKTVPPATDVTPSGNSPSA